MINLLRTRVKMFVCTTLGTTYFRYIKRRLKLNKCCSCLKILLNGVTVKLVKAMLITLFPCQYRLVLSKQHPPCSKKLAELLHALLNSQRSRNFRWLLYYDLNFNVSSLCFISVSFKFFVNKIMQFSAILL